MNAIKFTYLWDKLREPSFTTIRSWSKEKEDYYESWLASEFQVWKCQETYPFNREHVLFHAYLADVQVLDTTMIPWDMLLKDVKLNGVPDQKWIDKIQKMHKAIVLTFVRYPINPISRQTRLEVQS